MPTVEIHPLLAIFLILFGLGGTAFGLVVWALCKAASKEPPPPSKDDWKEPF